MNASQDAWAGPLAKRLVSRFRTQALSYIRVQPGSYDEETGTIPIAESSIPAAGAVARTRKVERDGVQQGHEIEAWIDHQTVQWPISTNDRLEYLGKRWKITGVVSYGSGMTSTGGEIHIMTLDGKIITTLDGKALVVQGGSPALITYSMYASKLTARAE
jgi:hypothetical protein